MPATLRHTGDGGGWDLTDRTHRHPSTIPMSACSACQSPPGGGKIRPLGLSAPVLRRRAMVGAPLCDPPDA